MTSIILFAFDQSNRRTAPGREGIVIGIARLSRLVATGALTRCADSGALTPRRSTSSAGVSPLAGRGGFLSGFGPGQPLLSLGPAFLGVPVKGDRLPQGGARPVVRKTLAHLTTPRCRCIGRAERETCHCVNWEAVTHG